MDRPRATPTVKLAATTAPTPWQAASLAGLDYVRGYAGELPPRGDGLAPDGLAMLAVFDGADRAISIRA